MIWEPCSLRIFICRFWQRKDFGGNPPIWNYQFDDTEPARQRYECHDCDKRFDDLTDTIFAGHHQPLKVWVLCLYFMGLNLSNEQMAHELSINESDAYQMTTALRGGIVKKASRDPLQRGGVRRSLCDCWP